MGGFSIRCVLIQLTTLFLTLNIIAKFIILMKQYKEIEIENLEPLQTDLLIALLAEAGYTGFEESEDSKGLKAFIEEDNFQAPLLDAIIKEQGLSYKIRDIQEENWNALWESNFEPVIVDDFVALRADFHPNDFPTQYEIIITPKMSFGTGHHATTYMMIQQMRQLKFENQVVFDFGTGTGILAILADKLGAQEVLAVDNDDWSIENATENIKRNGTSHIRLKKAHTAAVSKKFNTILANINKNVIIANAEILVSELLPGGTLLLSGLLREDEATILELFTQLGLIHSHTDQRAQWICMVWQLKA